MPRKSRPNPTPEVPYDVIYTTERKVACDGGNRNFGHPKVYLAIKGDLAECPYCSCQFIYAPKER